MSRDLAGKFSGRNTFIQAVEETVKQFYIAAGQCLEAWTPPAPKVKKIQSEDIHEVDEPEEVKLVQVKDPENRIEAISEK